MPRRKKRKYSQVIIKKIVISQCSECKVRKNNRDKYFDFKLLILSLLFFVICSDLNIISFIMLNWGTLEPKLYTFSTIYGAMFYLKDKGMLTKLKIL